MSCNARPQLSEVPVDVQAKNILVAVGGFPSKAPIEGAEHAIVSDEILQLQEHPNK